MNAIFQEDDEEVHLMGFGNELEPVYRAWVKGVNPIPAISNDCNNEFLGW